MGKKKKSSIEMQVTRLFLPFKIIISLEISVNKCNHSRHITTNKAPNAR